MAKPNLAAMSKIELKPYFFKDRNDTEVCYALMDKIASEPIFFCDS
jgi:hypothetical protein